MSFSSNSIDFTSNIPYYIQLIELLKHKIESAIWNPGDQIPSEFELCETYKVSRTVVRQSLKELELEGLIFRRKGKGTFIAEAKINESLVQKLTGFHQDMIERGITPITEVLRFETVPATSKVANFLQLDPSELVFTLERLRFVEGEPVLIVTTYIPHKLCPELENFDFADRSLYDVLEVEFGLLLSHGRRTIEAVSADKREAALLHIDEGDPLILLDSVTYLNDGTPVEYYHAIHRGDRSRFEVNLVRLKENDSLEQFVHSSNVKLPNSN